MNREILTKPYGKDAPHPGDKGVSCSQAGYG